MQDTETWKNLRRKCNDQRRCVRQNRKEKHTISPEKHTTEKHTKIEITHETAMRLLLWILWLSFDFPSPWVLTLLHLSYICSFQWLNLTHILPCAVCLKVCLKEGKRTRLKRNFTLFFVCHFTSVVSVSCGLIHSTLLLKRHEELSLNVDVPSSCHSHWLMTSFLSNCSLSTKHRLFKPSCTFSCKTHETQRNYEQRRENKTCTGKTRRC